MVASEIEALVSQLLHCRDPSARLRAAYLLAAAGDPGAHALAEIATNNEINPDIRIAAESSLPPQTHREPLVRIASSFLAAKDPVIRYCGIRRCVRSGLFELAETVRELRSDSSAFVEIDEEIRIGETAQRAHALLQSRIADPEFTT